MDNEIGAGENGTEVAAPVVDQRAAEHISTLTQTVNILARNLDELKATQNNSNAMLQQLAQATHKTSEHVQHTAETLFGDDVDMDNLTPRQLAQMIASGVGKVMDGKLQTLQGQTAQAVQTLAAQFETRNASDQIAKSAEKNADFFEYADEMRQVLKENPTLTVNRAYNLAKSENPEKAAKMALKYAKPEEDTGNGTITLFPSSHNVSNKGKGPGRMNAQDAASSAFDTLFAGAGASFNKQGNILI